jgi:undecaprenyl phosphate N,N'-diacetylbacillosamine 1-phosphate transferase
MLSVLALPLLAMITLAVGFSIWLEDKGSVFFVASRRGMNGKIFKMLKFRSMKMNADDIRNKDNSTFNSRTDPRVTRVGRFLRATSIDELPQILNVIKGDMSLIGPRAPIPREGIEYEDLNEMQRKRLSRTYL